MITSIEVKNYKMLDSIKVEGFSRINIFVGQNNCGKTSLLEAILFNLDSRGLFRNTRDTFAMRQLFRINKDNLSYLFSYLDINKAIQITSIFKNNQHIKLEISPEYNSQTHIISNDEIAFNQILTQSEIIGLKSIAQNNSNKKIQSKFVIQKHIANNGMLNDNIVVTDAPNTKEFSFNILFIPSNINIVDVNSFIQKIRIDKKEQQLVQYLQIFDENVLGIETIGNQTMIDLQDMPQKVNIGIMGEGFKKYLFIIAGMLTYRFQYICIDEIENGLHFKTTKKLIESILKLSKQTDIQLFITTHNLEFLGILSKVMQEQNYEKIAIFNIAKTKMKGMQAFRYDSNGLQTFLENNAEFRN